MTTNAQLEQQLKHCLSETHYRIVSDIIADLGSAALGPLCSYCEHAEATIDIIYPMQDCKWSRLVQLSCRCTKTLKEQPAQQIYLNDRDEITPYANERHYSREIHKAYCPHFVTQQADKNP